MTALPLTLRFAAPDDARAVDRLAALDSRDVPPGRLLLAEQDGELVAALSLASGAAIADPFRLTADVVALLRARAAQLEAPRRGLRRLTLARAR